MHPSKQFSAEQKEAIVQAIQEAERNSSGEIRVHIENHCNKNVLDRATQVFAELNMHKTVLRNGILIYIALQDRKLAIIGDVGINTKVPTQCWEQIKDLMLQQFKNGKLCEGICQGILEAGQRLKAFFPYQEDDINELPDDISFQN